MKKHVFTGVFIPAKIWMSKELTPQKKMIMAEIKALSEETGWCFANNGHFAEWLLCSPQNVSNAIRQMHRDGLIEITYMDERTCAGRKMRVNLEWYHGEQYPYTGSVPPYTGSVPPYTGSVPPYTGSVTEIQSKYTSKEVEEETRESDFSQFEEKPLLAKDSGPAAAAPQTPAPHPFQSFDIDRAAESLTADPLCVDRFGRTLACSLEVAAAKHPAAVTEFVADQKAVGYTYNNDRDFRSHYFNWLPLRVAKKRAEAQKQVQVSANTTFIPKNIPVFR